jgi:polynucleotide 5'-kinase involved in rRNA processing
MTEGERNHLFEWLQKNYGYKDSLEKQEDTQIFHARFNPDNQYIVKTNYEGMEDERRTFKMGDKYYIDSKSSIIEEYIISVEKIVPNREY